VNEAAARGASVLHRFRFRAMNTNIEIGLYCGEADIRNLEMRSRGWFENVESAFSRFWPGSELCRLNRSAGRSTLVSDNMLEVLLLAESYRKRAHSTRSCSMLCGMRDMTNRSSA